MVLSADIMSALKVLMIQHLMPTSIGFCWIVLSADIMSIMQYLEQVKCYKSESRLFHRIY